jgi:hypothetical protein
MPKGSNIHRHETSKLSVDYDVSVAPKYLTIRVEFPTSFATQAYKKNKGIVLLFL